MQMSLPNPDFQDQYTGTFAFLNATGHTIKNAKVTHRCLNMVVPPQSIPENEGDYLPQLENLEVSRSVKYVTYSNCADQWDVEFTLGSPSVKYSGVSAHKKGSKKCDLPNENTNKTCIIILYADAFSIITPDDGPCVLNDY